MKNYKKKWYVVLLYVLKRNGSPRANATLNTSLIWKKETTNKNVFLESRLRTVLLLMQNASLRKKGPFIFVCSLYIK